MHSSLITGARGSAAKIKVFKVYNDLKQLEAIIRKSIWEGQPRTHQPGKKDHCDCGGSMEGRRSPILKKIDPYPR